ncbi:MAG: ISKra4 family transposase, partial [Gemmatimonadaceae bacterium]|nr:ISKra4 family transposase [Gloeobacterales cyanobacterium ES-bin-141]
MQFEIQVVCTDGAGRQTTHSLTSVTRDAAQLLPATFGLSLAEGKSLLQQLQAVVTQQQTSAFLAAHRRCGECESV